MTTFLLDHIEGCTPVKPCASCEAANFLRSKLSKEDFNVLLEKIRATTPKETPPSLESSIDILDLTLRPYNCLKAENILTIGDLIKNTPRDLLMISNLGRKALSEIKEKLAERQLGLAEA